MKNAKGLRYRKGFDPGRLIKLGGSALIFAYDSLCALLCKIFGRRPKATCVVLYYHSVPASQHSLFAKQLDTIARTAKVVDITREVVLEPEVRSIGITFDDAFENFFSEAFPELQERNMPATMFVIAGALGKAFGPVAKPEKVMSIAQLKALPPALISIGSHTLTHPYMPELDEDTAELELREAKAILERLLDREIHTFSFPFGGFTNGLVALARDVGYKRIFTTQPVFAFANDPSEFVVGRVRVDPTDWPIEFRLKLAGAYRWLPLAISCKRRFMIFGKNRQPTSTVVSTRSSIQEESSS